MQRFKSHLGMVAPLDRSHVDTDQIIPKQFLKSIERTGFGVNLFDSWRYLDEGRPGQQHNQRPVNPDFVLNELRYEGASILLVRENFGCGSSREHAPWALMDYGFRVVIGCGFASIFYHNCIGNGLLPVVLPPEQIEELFRRVAAEPGYQLSVDLLSGRVTDTAGFDAGFGIADSDRHRLLDGLDEIGLSLELAEQIRGYEVARRQQAPWLLADVRVLAVRER